MISPPSSWGIGEIKMGWMDGWDNRSYFRFIVVINLLVLTTYYIAFAFAFLLYLFRSATRKTSRYLGKYVVLSLSLSILILILILVRG